MSTFTTGALAMSVSIGSISSGTHRLEDLIPAYVSALDDIADDLATSGEADNARMSGKIHDTCAEIEDRMYDDDSNVREEYFESEEATYDLETLTDLLGEFAPPFCYFGAHEGDGADFGFWLSRDALDEAEHDGEVVKVAAGDEWPQTAADAEYVLEVTDHGNITLFSALTKKELWSLV
jgi:hypothetical protein